MIQSEQVSEPEMMERLDISTHQWQRDGCGRSALNCLDPPLRWVFGLCNQWLDPPASRLSTSRVERLERVAKKFSYEMIRTRSLIFYIVITLASAGSFHCQSYAAADPKTALTKFEIEGCSL